MPLLSRSSTVLYYACLAYATNVLFLWGKVSYDAREQYQARAIETLIPLLEPHRDTSARKNDDLLLTSVILRMSEQFSEPEVDRQCHLYGAFSLFAISRFQWPCHQVDAAGIAFWTYVRQSIRACFLKEQPCPWDIGIVDSRDLTSPAEDEAWTNRITYLLARTCNLCWSPRRVEAGYVREFGFLSKQLEAWKSLIPSTFQPWHSTEPTRHSALRRQQYFSPWHAVGWQQFYVAQILLAVYQPLSTFESICLADVHRKMLLSVTTNARLLCAVVFSSDDIGSSFNGSHLVDWSAQYLDGKLEREQIRGWLENFHAKTLWPNKHSCLEYLNCNSPVMGEIQDRMVG